MDDCFLTIRIPAEIEIKVKGSHFIGRTYLVDTSEKAVAELERIRKKEYSATHNCFAYIVGNKRDDITFKYSDDGEPGGTAGKPIYDVIKGSNLTNILLVVTRYFGGTKLGTGGLVRAYSKTAKLALEKSGVKENFITVNFKIEVDFSRYDNLLKMIHKLGAVQQESDFSDRVTLILEIRQNKAEQLRSAILELSAGKAKIEKIN